ncbi:unnamed protein product [Mytilus edulis]|uniref:Uncharacterized protein n=1 Tax=Mytilus edulis TaxID=6550 RepID=A0A8S3R1H1_MYTED|nr:unnamed protein product [Mytilus edulis]
MAGSAPEDCVYIDLSGASSGIGEATAIKLAEHGATLFLVALEEDKLQIVQQKCKEKGLVEEKIGYCSGDLSQSAFREEIVKNLIQKFGRLDILADIAGSVLFANVCETKEEDYDRFVRVNQKAKFFLAQLCLPYLKQPKGLTRSSRCKSECYQMADKFANLAHLKRAGTPADVVSLLLFLASDEASYITGSINYIDGGYHLYP